MLQALSHGTSLHAFLSFLVLAVQHGAQVETDYTSKTCPHLTLVVYKWCNAHAEHHQLEDFCHLLHQHYHVADTCLHFLRQLQVAANI